MRSETEYNGYWVEVWTRSTMGRGGLKYAADVRVTADPVDARMRYWSALESCSGLPTEHDALEEGMRLGFEWVDAVGG
jgi:hypothetical protein